MEKRKGKNSRINTRRPSMVGGERGWQQKVRGDGLGKRETKTILTMTYLPLCFVSGAMQALFNASPMVPINGEHGPRVGVVFRLIVTSIFDVTIGPTSTGQKLRFPSASESFPCVNDTQPTMQRR